MKQYDKTKILGDGKWITSFHNSHDTVTAAPGRAGRPPPPPLLSPGPPPSIIIPTLQPVELPTEWNTWHAATRAARDREAEYFGRLMGHVIVNLKLFDRSTYVPLTEGRKVNWHQFDSDGEFSLPRGQIPISRILELVDAQTVEYATAEDKEIVDKLYALQSPQSSQWAKPFVRLVSRHRFDEAALSIRIEYFVYFSRLVFELISDTSICYIVSKLVNPPVHVTPVKTRPRQPEMFKSTDADELLSHPQYQFSLTGVMKYAENKGYRMSSSQPGGLKVELYDFQKSTYQWLLDQELDAEGLNSYFWEQWAFTDGGGPMYYFPLAGEFRFERPPQSRGGLLCEEMGLGKTVEMISLILGNPSAHPRRMDGIRRFVDSNGDEVLPDLFEFFCEDGGSEDDSDGDSTIVKSAAAPSATPTAGSSSSSTSSSLPVPAGKTSRTAALAMAKEEQAKREQAKRDELARIKEKTKEMIEAFKTKPVLMGRRYTSTRATLIVVPRTLLQQWYRELHERVEGAGTEQFSILNAADLLQEIHVPLKDMRIPDLRPVGQGHFLDGQLARQHREPVNVRNTDRVPGEWGFPEANERFPLSICEFRLPAHAPSYKTFLGRCGFDKGWRRRRFFNATEDVAVKPAIDLEFDEYDVVLTTYESLRIHGHFYKRYNWHRVILDECQEIKVATNQIAYLCADIQTNYRWLVSGTPLCTKIEDLHGELNFLKVWPFCLSNAQDGFWDLKIGRPFKVQDTTALKLLYSLMDAVMMRHSKSQRFLDGRPLIVLPTRTIEWRSFPLLDRCDQYLYAYLENFAADSLARYLARAEEVPGNPEALIAWSRARHSEYSSIKSLLVLINRCITHPRTVSLATLDHLKRTLETPNVNVHELIRQITAAQQQHGGLQNEQLIVKMPPEIILEHVRQIGQGAGGSQAMNRSTNRELASLHVTELEQKAREQYESWSLAAMRNECARLDLPIPQAWIKLPFSADVTMLSNIAVISIDSELDETSINDLLPKAGDNLRIKFPSRDDAEVLVIAISTHTTGTKSSLKLDSPWELASVVEAPVYKRVDARRRDRYLDILVATSVQRSGVLNASSSSSNTHELNHGQSGFALLYKLMAGEAVDCPLCLNPCNRPCVTGCVHVYCYLCILQLISADQRRMPRCPICRRQIIIQAVIEADLSQIELKMADDDTQPLDALPLPTEVAEPEAVSSSSSSSSSMPAEVVGKRQKRGRGDIADPHDSSSRSDAQSKRSRSATAPHAESPNADDADMAHSETLFVLPPFRDCSRQGTTAEELARMPCPAAHHLVQRSVDYPSLSPIVLTFFDYYNRVEKIPSRMVAVLQDMKEVLTLSPFAKIVIFTQQPESIDAVESVLNYFNSRACRYTDFFMGKLKIAKVDSRQPGRVREANLALFQTDISCNVVILTTGNAAVGLTLTVAHVCYILEPMQNAAEEAQALSRVHRIGQVHEVKCVTFFAGSTVEERLLKMRSDDQNLTGLLSSTQSSSAFNVRALDVMWGASDEADGDEVSRRRQSNVTGEPRQQQLGYNDVDQLKVLYGTSAERGVRQPREQAGPVAAGQYVSLHDSIAVVARVFAANANNF